MNKRLWTVMAVGGLTLVACSSNSGPAPAPPSSSTPTDFTNFVTTQVQTQPAFGIAPMATSTLTQDQQLGNSTAYVDLNFGTGDALPAATNQAFVDCTEAGKATCNPSVSADLNSALN